MGKRKIITRCIVGLALLAGLAVFYNNRANGPTLDDLSPEDFVGYPGLPELLKRLQDAKKDHFESLEDADIIEILAECMAKEEEKPSKFDMKSRLEDYLGGDEKSLSLPPGYKGKLLEILRAVLREPRGIIYPKIYWAKLAIEDSGVVDEISEASLEDAMDAYQHYQEFGIPLDYIKTEVCRILSGMGQNASPAIPELLQLAKNPDSPLQGNILEILPYIGDDQIVPKLKRIVEAIPPELNYWTRYRLIEFGENGNLVLHHRSFILPGDKMAVVFSSPDQELASIIKNDNLQGYDELTGLTDIAAAALMHVASNTARTKLLNDSSPRIRATALLCLLDDDTTPDTDSPLFSKRLAIVLQRVREAPTPFERICAAKCLGDVSWRLRSTMAISDKLIEAFRNEKNTGVKAAILTAMDPHWTYDLLLEVAENSDSNLFFRRIAVDRFANRYFHPRISSGELEQHRVETANRLLSIALNEKNPPPLRNLAIVGAAKMANSPAVTAKIVNILQDCVDSRSQSTSGMQLGMNFIDVLTACTDPSILPFLKKLHKNQLIPQSEIKAINSRIAYFESKNNK